MGWGSEGAAADRPRPGRLKVFLGAAPGVGKTYRMLDEGRRRTARGTDVAVAYAECHGRPATEAMLDGLALLPRAIRNHRGTEFGELDLDLVLERRPEVVLIDELAHTNAPGCRHTKRWQDVEELLGAGIDVVATLNIQHLESLTDVVEKITGVPQYETVPDEVVRRADQIELVDLPAEGLRRRMAHGNIYPPEKVDAALSRYFRLGNLSALRELALLWVAGRVDEALRKYRHEHRIGRVWETRERVVVALSGGPEGTTLIRRAARIVNLPRALSFVRAGGTPIPAGDLLAVHITRSDGLAGSSPAALADQRQLTESLGGTYHAVVGDDVPAALLDFARAQNATQLVVGASRRGRLRRFLAPRGVGETVVELSGDIDVHTVSHEYAGQGRTWVIPGSGLPRTRRVAGPIAGLVLPLLLTLVLRGVSGPLSLNLTSEALLFLLTVLGVACIGGVVSALLASVTTSLLLNYYFIPPVGQFTFAEANIVVAQAAFTTVAVTVAAIVDRSLRLGRRAARATAEAETLSSLAGGILRGDRAVPDLLERTRETFGMDRIELCPRDDAPEPWPSMTGGTARGSARAVHTAGTAGEVGTDHRTEVAIGDDSVLVLIGRRLPASEHRVLTAFAAHLTAAVERARLAEAAAEVEPVKAANRMRTALLAAVGHDLRTPLAGSWAAISSLRSREVDFSPEDREELLATAEESLAKLSRLVDNLLDMSRLQAGALTLHLEPVALADVLPAALDTLPGSPPQAPGRVMAQALDTAPDVLADPPLLERVIANLVSNAVRHSPAGRPVTIGASALAGRVEVRITDRGPGIQLPDRERAFEPFQRLGDTDNTTGLGLGLALSRGLTEAMGGTLTPEETPGGGLTMVVSLPAAPEPHLPESEAVPPPPATGVAVPPTVGMAETAATATHAVIARTVGAAGTAGTADEA
ncbi:osmosensitive K channel His kinase sensor [Streptomyces noursei ATCC 11455]|uniref:sensor histidine kinase n=1 Tax=Streptomyces noursei TaxID=1971 RepID=UPI00081CAE7E|nr:osmosensitive K channel His kinase sensor [Streptomyces noursei ATCC 11455]